MPARSWFEPITLGALPGRAAARWGAREAVWFRGRRWTFAEVAAGVDGVARGLLALGVRPGDKVALWMLNRPEWIEIAFAVFKIGAVLVPVNTRLRTDDVAYLLEQSDSSTLILAERSGPVDYLAMIRELVPFHLFAFSEGMLTSLVTGARQILTEGFDAAESLELIARRAGDRAPRLRHALQGAGRGARPAAA